MANIVKTPEGIGLKIKKSNTTFLEKHFFCTLQLKFTILKQNDSSKNIFLQKIIKRGEHSQLCRKKGIFIVSARIRWIQAYGVPITDEFKYSERNVNNVCRLFTCLYSLSLYP